MIGHNENRLLDIWIATGKSLEFEVHKVTLDREKAEEASKRYGIEMIADRSDDRDPRSHARYFFEMARRMFLHDGHHVFMVIVFKDGRPIEMREGRLEEHGQKYVFMRRLANDVLRMGGDAVLTIGEVWRAKPDPAFAYRRVVDMPEREEALAATLVMKDGEPLQLSAMIRRSEDKVELEDTIEVEGGFPYALAPVYAVWGRDAPGSGRGPRIGVLKRRKLRWLSSTALP